MLATHQLMTNLIGLIILLVVQYSDKACTSAIFGKYIDLNKNDQSIFFGQVKESNQSNDNLNAPNHMKSKFYKPALLNANSEAPEFIQIMEPKLSNAPKTLDINQVSPYELVNEVWKSSSTTTTRAQYDQIPPPILLSEDEEDEENLNLV